MTCSLYARTRRIARFAPMALLFSLGACEATSGPANPASLDTETAMRDYRAVESLMASDGWSSVAALGGRTPLSAGAAVSLAAITDMQSLHTAEGSRTYMRSLFGRLNRSADADISAPIILISNTYRGQTFVYDSALDQYVVDSARQGAPSNGVRFVLYATDNAERPIPAREIGYADLTDEGTASDDAMIIRLKAVEGSRTVMDYRTRVVIREGGGTIGVSGFAADARNRLEFSIDAAGEEQNGSTKLNLDFTLRVPTNGFSVVGKVRGVDDGGAGEGTVNLTVRHGRQTLALVMEGDGELLDGTISFNGKLFVTISGDANAPTLRGATGEPITGAELLVVLHVVDIIDDVFDMVEDLLQPVDNLIVLGWIL